VIPAAEWLRSLTDVAEHLQKSLRSNDDRAILRATADGIGLLLAREIDRVAVEAQPSHEVDLNDDPRQTRLFAENDG